MALLKSALERTKKGLESGVSNSKYMAAVDKAKHLKAQVGLWHGVGRSSRGTALQAAAVHAAEMQGRSPAWVAWNTCCHCCVPALLSGLCEMG